MRRWFIVPLLLFTLLLTACPKVEQNARDAAAALGGAITSAQAQHQTECVANPSGPTCVLINKAVDGQNVLVTSIEAYCQWQPGVLPADPNATCVGVKSAEQGLKTAIANANIFITQLKGVIK